MLQALKAFHIPIFAVLPLLTAGFTAHPACAQSAGGEGEPQVRVIVLLNDQPNSADLEPFVDGLPRKERSKVVWQELGRFTEPRQAALLEVVEAMQKTGLVTWYRQLRLVNALLVEGSREVVESLARHPDVQRIMEDSVRPLDDTSLDIEEQTHTDARMSAELDEVGESVQRIGAPQAWEQGWTGEGVLVAIIDTGVNWRHADLAGHLWDGGEEYPFHGYDFHDNDPDPMDTSGHGTAVAGIVAGDGTAGTITGVAPGATLMCLRVRANLNLGTVGATWAAQDFALEQGVDVTSMSLGWGNPAAQDRPIWRNNYEILNVAGIVNVKSAGNRREERTPPDAISVPGDVPSPFRHPDESGVGGRGGLITVGGVDVQDSISTVSSPGPVSWGDVAPWFDYPLNDVEPGLIKPDLCAPATDGLSTVYNDDNGYGSFQNTSMAQPHVAGTVALILSRNPDLLPVQVDSILQMTALELGAPGKDNDYGAGRVRADLAVDAAGSLNVGEPTRNRTGLPTFRIDSIAPNPFNSSTRVEVELHNIDPVTLALFDLLGRQVNRFHHQPKITGRQTFLLDAEGLAGGIYFLRMEQSGQQAVQKLLLLR